MRGEKIVRKPDDDGPKDPLGSAVPTPGGRLRPRGEPGTGGMEPQPQVLIAQPLCRAQAIA